MDGHKCIYHECKNHEYKPRMPYYIIKFEGLYDDKYLMNIEGCFSFTIDYCPFCGIKLEKEVTNGFKSKRSCYSYL